MRPILLALVMTLAGGAASAVDGGAGPGTTNPGPSPQADFAITVRNLAWATVRAGFWASADWTRGGEVIGGQSLTMQLRASVDSMMQYEVEVYTGSFWRSVCTGSLSSVLRWDGDRRAASLRVEGAFWPADHWNCTPE